MTQPVIGSQRGRRQVLWDVSQQRLWEAVNVPVIVADTRARIEWFNSAFAKASGQPLREIAGANLRAVFLEAGGANRFEETWQEVLSGKTRDLDALRLGPDGMRAVRETLVPLTDSEGAVGGVAAIEQEREPSRAMPDSILPPEPDLADRELEKILDVPAVQALLVDISRLTGMAIAILDLRGRILVATGWQRICVEFHRVHPKMSCNCTASDLFLAEHLRPGEHVEYRCKNGLWDVATPLFVGEMHVGNLYVGQFLYDDEAVDVEAFGEQAASCGIDRESYLQALAEVPRVSREKVNCLMGFLVRLASMVSRLSYGNLKLARAIREQQESECALRKSEENFRLLVEQAPVPIAISGEDGTIDFLNKRFVGTFGYTRDDIPNTAVWFARAYRDPDYRAIVAARWEARLEQARRGAEIEPGEFQVTCKDGSPRTVEIFGTRIGDRTLVLFNDISERRKSELERARLEQELQQAQKMEAVGRLAGGVAHDFNNLLTVINGYSELALGAIPAGSAVGPALRQILEAGERATDLTRQLLAFSRKQVIQPVTLNLNDIVHGASQILRRIIGEDIELVCLLEPALWRVTADAGQMHQVLMNLAVNARDAMPDGGELVIETRNLEIDGQAAPEARVPPGAYVELSVRDSGLGMSEEVQQHIFEPFFTTKEAGKGTGLGLAMVFGIVKQSGGHIRVESQVCQGTALRLCLPRSEVAAPRNAPGDAGAGGTAGRETVLVVEDQQDVLELTCTILGSYGYRVLRASSGEEALRICEASPEPIDAMITDVVMPRMSGWDLAARVAGLRPKIRIVYMSGYTGLAPARDAPGYAPGDLLQKPFSPDQLVAALRRSLDRPGD